MVTCIGIMVYIVVPMFISLVFTTLVSRYFEKKRDGDGDSPYYDNYKYHLKLAVITEVLVLLPIMAVVSYVKETIEAIVRFADELNDDPMKFFKDVGAFILWPFLLPYAMYKIYDLEKTETIILDMRRERRKNGNIQLAAHLQRESPERLFNCVSSLLQDSRYSESDFLRSGNEKIDKLLEADKNAPEMEKMNVTGRIHK